MMRRIGSNVARAVARTVTFPIPSTDTDRATVTATVRGFHDASTGHTHRTSRAPLSAANLAASRAGVPFAPKGRNVTGAAASAAASAAFDAAVYPAIAVPTAATAITRTTTSPTTATPTATDPRSPFGPHDGAGGQFDREASEEGGGHPMAQRDLHRRRFADRRRPRDRDTGPRPGITEGAPHRGNGLVLSLIHI
mgnify:CR=1 FL=1